MTSDLRGSARRARRLGGSWSRGRPMVRVLIYHILAKSLMRWPPEVMLWFEAQREMDLNTILSK